MNKKIIILGHTGLLGTKIYEKFKKKKKTVIGFSSKNCDFRNIEDFSFKIRNSFKNSSIIYSAGRHRKYGSTRKLYHENILIIKNLIQLCKKNKPNKILFLSTVEVYKPHENELISEKSNTRPINLYAKGKLLQEKLLSEYCKNNQISLLILRLPGFYDPKDNNSSIVSKLIYCCLYDKIFLKRTSGKEQRDYLFTSDLVDIIYLLEKKKFKIDILNIAKGYSISLNQLINKVNFLFSKKIKFKKTKNKKNFSLRFENYKLKQYIKNFKFISIEDGIKKYKSI